MRNNNQNQNNFSAKRLLFATVPSYIIPAIMSFTSGYFLNKPDLMRASYSTIATPSLIASLLTFILLWRMEAAQKFPANKIVRALFMVIATVTLGFMAILCFGLQENAFDILSSSFLGAVITTLTQPMTKLKSKYE